MNKEESKRASRVHLALVRLLTAVDKATVANRRVEKAREALAQEYARSRNKAGKGA